MTQNFSKREQKRVRQRRQQARSIVLWSGLGVLALVVVGAVIWQGIRPRAGQAVPIMQSTHIPTDSDPGQHNSDPPTSGPHYSGELEPGFYESNSYQYPAGYLTHNLEHGYIIFWYNCAKLDEAACVQLKSQLRSIIDEFKNVKVIAYPWEALDAPVAMTSWGRLQKMERFDATQARAFYRANLNRAPEPNAP